MEERIKITNSINDLPVLTQNIEALGKKWELPLRLIMSINLVLEEAVTNIIFYAFENKAEHEIEITIALNNRQLEITIVDDGKPFDPTQKAQPDITLPAEDRAIGGLGIFLIQKMMDEVIYRRKNNHNLLKKINLK